MHYTAGPTLSSAVDWFLDRKARASAHFVIGRDGEVVQMVPLNYRAWHAGVSEWGHLVGMNQYAIGIELVNAGKLRRRSDGAWVNWSNRPVPDNEVTVARHKSESEDAGWQEYTDVQVQRALAVATVLNDAFGFADVLGHEDVSPGRKVDPGPLFPLNSFRSRVLGRA
jgi:N-acetylmuramoyl-L-alanine amidase